VLQIFLLLIFILKFLNIYAVISLLKLVFIIKNSTFRSFISWPGTKGCK